GAQGQNRDDAGQEAPRLTAVGLGRQHARMEEGDRDARCGPENRRAVRERLMPLRKFKPTTPGRRFMSISGFDEVTATEPEKTLVESLQTHAGRNNQGRITTRHHGGGYRKLYRKIGFKRDKHGVPGKVATIEHENESSGKAARSGWLGVRPTIRGSTMNPRDHPHGGGEGKTGPGGNPKSPWGQPALGFRTRKPKKASNKLIIRRREKKGRKK